MLTAHSLLLPRLLSEGARDFLTKTDSKLGEPAGREYKSHVKNFGNPTTAIPRKAFDFGARSLLHSARGVDRQQRS